MGKRSTFERDFWSKVSRGETCWLWTACIGSDGYGHFRLGDRVVAAHRVAFELAHGRQPRGHLLHSCDDPLCVNPAHLREGTHQENMRDCAIRRRNRSPRPGNGYRKLTDVAVAEIRARFSSGETNRSALARSFGVTPTRIRQVLNG